MPELSAALVDSDPHHGLGFAHRKAAPLPGEEKGGQSEPGDERGRHGSDPRLLVTSVFRRERSSGACANEGV